MASGGHLPWVIVPAVCLLGCTVGLSPGHAAVTVRTVEALKSALDQANADPNADRTILLEDGTYHLAWSSLWIGRDGVTIAGKSGRREAVVLRGQRGMRGGQIEFIFQVSADDVTLRDLTMEDVGSHAVLIHGEPPHDADRTTLRNLVIRDTFEQMVKVTPANSDPQKFFSEGGVLEDSLLEYSAGIGPQFYIGGIDAHGAKDWIVRRNVFRHIISPARAAAEHAVHFWSWSAGTLVENNLIIECDRGIGLGLSNSGHSGGIVRNNLIFHSAENRGGFADVAIEFFHGAGAQIYNNTIWQAHDNYFAAIKNWHGRDVTIANNLVLMNAGTPHGLADAIWVVEGTGRVLSNVVTVPKAEWFSSVTPPAVQRVSDVGGFLHLRDASVTAAIDQGTSEIANLPEPFVDFDGQRRPRGRAIDVGADEFPLPSPGAARSIEVRDALVRTAGRVEPGGLYPLQRSVDLLPPAWSSLGKPWSAGAPEIVFEPLFPCLSPRGEQGPPWTRPTCRWSRGRGRVRDTLHP